MNVEGLKASPLTHLHNERGKGLKNSSTHKNINIQMITYNAEGVRMPKIKKKMTLKYILKEGKQNMLFQIMNMQ